MNTPSPESIAIRSRRCLAGLRRPTVAAAVGVTEFTIGVWERGDGPIPAWAIAPLAQVLGCSPGELLDPPPGAQAGMRLDAISGRRPNDPGRPFSPVALRTWRALRGCTQTTLSDATAVPVSTICDWEHGRRLPTAEQLARVADALECAPSDFEAIPVLVQPDQK